MKNIFLIATLLVTVLCFAGSVRPVAVWAKASSGLGKAAGNIKNSQIDIKSDSLEVNNKTGVATFSGNVHASKGDLEIFSNVLNVYYAKNNSIKSLIAEGNVRIIKKDDYITGDKAVYYNVSGVAVITGNPVAHEGRNEISGKKIVINFKTNISTVFGSAGNRVNATVYSNKSLNINSPKPGKKTGK